MDEYYFLITWREGSRIQNPEFRRKTASDYPPPGYYKANLIRIALF
jgi:hypothetical protein